MNTNEYFTFVLLWSLERMSDIRWWIDTYNKITTNLRWEQKIWNVWRERQINFLLTYLNTCFGHISQRHWPRAIKFHHRQKPVAYLLYDPFACYFICNYCYYANILCFLLKFNSHFLNFSWKLISDNIIFNNNNIIYNKINTCS